ncbi:MAG: type II toxin-antitoxin system CcdA family antitoxin [Methanobrevibacter sp.]|nr:type II toxin-antitoxin system CcdA family antitoxin [Methanobrevibacter sp.]
MSNKTKVSLSIDTDLLILARSKYPNLSARVNQLLSIDLHAEDEESLLMKDIASLQDELELKMEKLQNVRQQHYNDDTTNLDKVLSWAKEIYERKGVLGLNILQRQCKRHKVSYTNVKNILEQEDIAFINYDG